MADTTITPFTQDLVLVIPYFTGDQDNALKLVKWIADLGEYKSHKAIIAHDYRTDPEINKEIQSILFPIFKQVGLLRITGDSWNDWKISPQHMFKSVARYMEHAVKEDWFWIEPDAVPLKKGWLDAIAKAHRAGGKPFTGAFVPDFRGSGDHMSGVAVYPWEITKYAGEYLWAHDIPFDLVGAKQAMPQAKFTDLIQHKWDRDWNEGGATPKKEPPFKTYEEFRAAVTTEAVIFHADKSLTLIDIIRPHILGSATETTRPSTDLAGNSETEVRRALPTQNNLVHQMISEPAEGTRRDGLVYKNGSWHNEANLDKLKTKAEKLRANAAKAREAKAAKNKRCFSTPCDCAATLSQPVTKDATTTNTGSGNGTYRSTYGSPDEALLVVKSRFTSPLAKARIIRSLKAAPIIKT